ncbi:MAG: universal stress protein [Desulfomonilia bacterium]|nr:universal stress protein [Desulfomonilia bacterium]
MFSKILLGVDGSETSKKSASYAVELAKNCKSTILLVHVVDLSAFRNVIANPREIAKHVYEKIMEEAQGYLDAKEEFCKKNGVACEKILKIGHPVDEMITIAEESGASLIVVGSKGRSGLGGSVFGSVSYGVLHRDKNIPVFVVKS